MLTLGLTAAAVLFAVTCYVLGDPPNTTGDAGAYTRVGIGIAENGLSSYDPSTVPYLFPSLVALWALVVGPDFDRIHDAMFAMHLAAHVAASFWIAQRLARVFRSRVFGVAAYACAVLNPFLLISSGELLRESLSASTLGVSVLLIPGTGAPDERRGLSLRMGASLFLAAIAVMLRPTSLAVLFAVVLLWGARALVFRDVPWQGWVVGAVALAVPFIPQAALNHRYFGSPNPFVVGTGLYENHLMAGARSLKYGGVMVPSGDVGPLIYPNPLLPPGVFEPLGFVRVSPLGYIATLGIHLFALVDVDFPFVYIRDLDPWYRWPLSFLNYLYLFLALAGAGLALARLRDGAERRRVFAIVAGIFAAGAYVSTFLPVVVETRYGTPIFMLVVPSVAAGLLAAGIRVHSGKWRPLLAPALSGAIFIGSCAVLSAWIQEQAPLLRERPREARLLASRVARFQVDPPTAWAPGESRTYDIVITNVGYVPWLARGPARVYLGVHFGSVRTLYAPEVAYDQAFDLPEHVAVQQSQRLTLTVTAPTEPGCYYLYHRPITEGGTWFGEHNYTAVEVGDLRPEQRGVDGRTGKGPCEPPENIPSAPYQ